MRPMEPDEIRASFEVTLRDLSMNGIPVPTHSGLDMETVNALDNIARKAPSVPPTLIALARSELEKQLDGTHAREQMDRLFGTQTSG